MISSGEFPAACDVMVVGWAGELIALGIYLGGQAWPAMTVTSSCVWAGTTSSVPALSDRPSRLVRAVTGGDEVFAGLGA